MPGFTGTHSKSGSSGSESCVPHPPLPQNTGLTPGATQGQGSGPPRCSSVDNLCTAAQQPPPPNAALRSNSLQHGAAPPSGDYFDKLPAQVHRNNGNRTSKLNIEVVGGGYGFLPPSKFVASEPIYSDASTPVVIRRRSSVTAVEPDTPPYERTASSFSTFTEPQLPRAVLRGSQALHQALLNATPGKAVTVGSHGIRIKRPPSADSKHATIGGAALPKGFHQPGHADPRYFSVPAAKPQGTRVHPAPITNYPQPTHNTQPTH